MSWTIYGSFHNEHTPSFLMKLFYIHNVSFLIYVHAIYGVWLPTYLKEVFSAINQDSSIVLFLTPYHRILLFAAILGIYSYCRGS